MAHTSENQTIEELADLVSDNLVARLSKSFGNQGNAYPWSLPLQIPKYNTFENGTWKLIKNSIPCMRGYYSGLTPMLHDNYALIQKPENKVWMSLTPMELESQAPHAYYAKGHTMVAGLGMGAVLFNILANPAVTKVTVIEHDPEVIKLFYQITDVGAWPGYEKLQIVQADIYSCMTPDVIDFLAIDIHQCLGDPDLRPDTQKICRRLHPLEVGVWGIELDFVTWCQESGIPVDEVEDMDWQDYSHDIGVPLFYFDGIAQYAVDCAQNTYLA